MKVESGMARPNLRVASEPVHIVNPRSAIACLHGRMSLATRIRVATGGDFRAGLVWLERGPDEVCEVWNFGAWDSQSVADDVVERQFQFHAGFGQTEHDVADAAALAAYGCAGMDEIEAAARAVDMPLRSDNANAGDVPLAVEILGAVVAH
jgi:hypothetical protein